MHIWKGSNLGFISNNPKECSIAQWSRNWLWYFMQKDQFAELYVMEFMAILWSIWLNMNRLIFNQEKRSYPTIIMEQIRIWKTRRWQTYGENAIGEKGQINLLKKTKGCNHLVMYANNWKEEDKRWCLRVDGSWKKSICEGKEEWKAAYGWHYWMRTKKLGMEVRQSKLCQAYRRRWMQF